MYWSYKAGQTSQRSGAIAIGAEAGNSNQRTTAIAIGYQAGYRDQSGTAIAIGFATGFTNQRSAAVAVGYQAGNGNQGTAAIAIGVEAGFINQQTNSIAIGYQAGKFQGISLSTIIGYQAGYNGGGTASVTIGYNSGYSIQANSAISIGYEAGYYNQGTRCIAIGYQAGFTNQDGSGAIAIGYLAGRTNQLTRSIIINATGIDLSSIDIGGLYIAPIRTGDTSGNLLLYEPTIAPSGEIVVSSSLSNFDKTFVIEHPTDNNKYLVHACIEGPEAGVYYRGKGTIRNNIMTTITMPEYSSHIATDFTIHISPIYDPNNDTEQLYNVSEVINSSFNVYGSNGSFYWIVHGKRNSIDIEPNKKDVIVKGDGPYKWI